MSEDQFSEGLKKATEGGSGVIDDKTRLARVKNNLTGLPYPA
jgi:hypothetical protein